MTTKAELKKEAEDNINRITAELNELISEHRNKFKAEDDAYSDYIFKLNEMELKREKILLLKYKNNWESKHNWYHGIIPTRFLKLCQEDHEKIQIVKSILSQIAMDNERGIVNSEEYKELKSNIDKLQSNAVIKSLIHLEIEDKIERLHNELEGWVKRNVDIEDRGKLIAIAKSIKEVDERKKVYSHRKMLESEIRAKIMEMIK